MNENVTSSVVCSDAFGAPSISRNVVLNKPMRCPHCTAFQDATTADKKLFARDGNIQVGCIRYKCSHCKKNYIVTFKIDHESNSADAVSTYPDTSLSYENELINGISPRFIEAYNQALRAESHGDIELAAIGYRHALECLVKDYAINELHMDRAEVVGKDLFQSIGTYLGEHDLIASADVIRILGNDYTHYERRYPELDFDLLKRYMPIFIHLVETKLLLAHPPVARRDSTKSQEE